MKKFWLVLFAVAAGGLIVFLLGRRRVEDKRELAFREELATLPSVSP